jgi:Na+/phosphate symporter
MLRQITRNRLVGLWFAVVAVLIASVVVMGVNVGVSTTALLLTLSLVPPAIILVLWRDAPPQTVGEILYETNRPKGGRS